MTSQRRRPDQTQRLLAIQASSRRNRNVGAAGSGIGSGSARDSREDRWEREANRSGSRYDSHFEQPVGASFRAEDHDRHPADRYQSPNDRYGDFDDRPRAARRIDDHRYADGYDNDRQPETWDSRESYGQSRGRSELDQDLEAMGKVWSMIRQGAVRMLGEVGRQY